MGKGEIACNKQFLFFPQCFLLSQIIVSPFVHNFDILSLFAAELEDPKIGKWGKGLKSFIFHMCILWDKTFSLVSGLSVKVIYQGYIYKKNGHFFWIASDRAFIFPMCIPCGKIFSVVSRSSVKVKYQDHFICNGRYRGIGVLKNTAFYYSFFYFIDNIKKKKNVVLIPQTWIFDESVYLHAFDLTFCIFWTFNECEN